MGGGLVKPAWFRRYRAAELPDRFDRVVQSWDTANKASELADFSVCTSWGIKADNLYLLDVLRGASNTRSQSAPCATSTPASDPMSC